MRPETLRRKEEFSALYENGSAYRDPLFVLIHMAVTLPDYRWAVVASRKVGGAVQRNRAKRLLREAHRSLMRRGLSSAGRRVALIARAATARATYVEVRESLDRACVEAGLIQAEPTAEQCQREL